MPPSSFPPASARFTSTRGKPSSSSASADGDERAEARAACAPGDPAGLGRELTSLKGIGPRRAADLARAGLRTVEDLLYRFPLRYEDRGRVQPIASLGAGAPAAIVGEIARCGLRRTRRPGFTIFEAVVRDESARVTAVWFNQRFLRDVFHPGQRVALFGKIERRPDGDLQVVSPHYESLDTNGQDDPVGGLHTGRIVPIHERIGTLTPRVQRALVAQALDSLPDDLADVLPADLRAARGWPTLAEALRAVHFPSPDADVEALNACRSPAQVRLVFDEFFQFQLGLALRQRELAQERKPFTVTVDGRVREAARAVLPFKLTPGQRQATREIVADLTRPSPMNRLLQGDVGAGKTVVAVLAAIVAMENRLQVAFMAPTELLAEQHFRTLQRLLAPSRFRVALLTGTTPPAERRRLRRALEQGLVSLVVGTHALVQETLRFKALGLVVIDEQHRFGVMQRAELRRKGLSPDVLVMTATPIPRTLALTTYGDLDVSVIHGRPPGRRPVVTSVRSTARREDSYAFVATHLDAGRQAYVVYPLIEESEKLDLRAATEMADHLASEVFPCYRVALLHGRMPADARERVMTAFVRREVDVLVSTSVVEVGIDVPNASVMVVEHAERFGLAQLHQLRGRVGRGPHASHCLLIYQSPLSEEGRRRLEALAATDDGFLIAERDLEIRGPGDFFGTRQSGLPALRVGDPIRDRTLMEEARIEARAWLDRAGVEDRLVARVRDAWASRFKLAGVG